jgi:hypothetical protein
VTDPRWTQLRWLTDRDDQDGDMPEDWPQEESG